MVAEPTSNFKTQKKKITSGILSVEATFNNTKVVFLLIRMVILFSGLQRDL